MSPKRHGKGKQFSQSKKGKAKQSYAPAVSAHPVAAQIPGSATPAGVSATPVKVPAQVSAPPLARYSYVTGELKRIGIIAGIILVILIVLALVLS